MQYTQGWRLEGHGVAARLHLSGSWIARQTGLCDPAMISGLLAESGQQPTGVSYILYESMFLPRRGPSTEDSL
jgi:hypothetical protein